MRAPDFWWRAAGLQSALLSPFGAIYGAVAGARLKREGTRASVPVICVGDPTVGGAGKTPASIAIAKLLQARGEKVFFLTRGYGGSEKGPAAVDPGRHGASDVGDEPLLLADTAPVIVSADRVAGAAFAAKSGASAIVMDDGFQNPSLRKDVSLLVVDAGSGAGNGLVFPAGPLRAPLEAQIARADAAVLIGEGGAGEAVARRAREVLHARIEPDAEALRSLKGKTLLAYAAIGRPEKFFATLQAAGCDVVARQAFPDHHAFSAGEAQALLAAARERHLTLVTTEKDRARMRKNPALAALAEESRALPISLRFEDEESLKILLNKAFSQSRHSGASANPERQFKP